jgi:drug/metabolite transporter (DMT)-like permease
MTSSWMLVAGALFATMGAFAKYLADQFSGAELSMYRSLIALSAVAVVVLIRRQSLKTNFALGHFWRGATGTVSLVGYFYAMTQLPLATAITLNYTSPLWLTILSTLLLRERFRPMLIVTILVGFVGVALLLRPTFSDNNLTAGLIGLSSGFFAACAYVNVKKLGEAGEPEWRVVFYFGVVGFLGSALTQMVWQGHFNPIAMPSIWPLLAMGLAATVAQLAMTRAYHSGNTLVVGAFSYSTVIFAAVFGLVFFDERLPAVAWLGMGIIVVSGLLAKRIGDQTARSASEQAARRPSLPAEED